jgi:hypothetical protein
MRTTGNKSQKNSTYQRSNGRRNKMIVSRERRRYIDMVSADSSYGCYYRVEQDLHVPRATVRYWYQKKQDARDADLHELPCGGQRNGVFEVWERPVVRQYIGDFLAAYPTSTVSQIAAELSRCFKRKVTNRVCLIVKYKINLFILN